MIFLSYWLILVKLNYNNIIVKPIVLLSFQHCWLFYTTADITQIENYTDQPKLFVKVSILGKAQMGSISYYKFEGQNKLVPNEWTFFSSSAVEFAKILIEFLNGIIEQERSTEKKKEKKRKRE